VLLGSAAPARLHRPRLQAPDRLLPGPDCHQRPDEPGEAGGRAVAAELSGRVPAAGEPVLGGVQGWGGGVRGARG